MKVAIILNAAIAALVLAFAGNMAAQNPQPCASVQNSATAGQVLSAATNGRTPACLWVTGGGGGGGGTVTSVATTLPIQGGTIHTTGTISCRTATTAVSGCLSSADWNTFNNKQGALTLTTTGSSGASTLIGTTLNIPQYSGGSGPSITQGAYASLPGTCTTNDLYVLTDSFYDPVRCSAANTWSFFLRGHSATLPAVCASWTVVNVATGAAACANSRGAIVLSTTSSVSGGYESALIATPAAPYIRTFAVSSFNLVAPAATLGSTCGVGYTDGTANTNAIQGIFIVSEAGGSGTPVGIRVWHMTAYDQTGLANDSSNFSIGANGPYVYFQLEDNNTNKFFRISTDGVNFNTIFSVSRTTNFTPTNMGIFCSGGVGGASLPWSITALTVNAGAQ